MIKVFVRASLLLLIVWSATAVASTSIRVSDAENGVTFVGQDAAGLTLRVDIGELELVPVNTRMGDFVLLTVRGLDLSKRVGEPALPTAFRLLAIPEGAELSVDILSTESVEYDLTEFGVMDKLMPAQPPLSKSDDPASVPFEFQRELYEKSGYYSLPVAETNVEGVMRGVRVGFVSVAPVEYDPVANRIRVQTQVTVRVNFDNPDWAATQKLFSNSYSPAFEPAYTQLGNYGMMNFSERTDLVRYPIKYVIVSHRMFEAQLQPFIAWKIRKGYEVIVAYTDIIGGTTTAIKSYLQGLYNAGTPEDPPPSFVLLVGDTPQIPAWSGTAGSHITDLKYCEYTGDYLPEVYYGRFSAQNTAQLQPQIDKTLQYEQYTMLNPSYLGEVTLIAGVDASYAPTYGNGQINYGTTQYFNAAHSITPHVWLYPASGQGGAAAAIIQTVNNGVGLINYTAHCGHDGFSSPSFTVSDIYNLTNANKYGLGIGNCCQSNTFGESTPCFGEAWLQAANKGGVGYLGASNNTYWDEDYWWAVGGGKAVVAAGPPYDPTRLGAYDGMFHDHGEPVTQHYITNYAINMCGNLAVQQSSSTRKNYYWEAYHLMGDPSVMTYLRVPTVNDVSYSASVLMTATSFTVYADPGSYVGISHNGVLHGAGYVDQSGSVEIELTPFDQPVTAEIVITAQNKEPYFGTVQVIAPEGPYVIYHSHTIDDASGNNNGLVDFGESIILGVQLHNVGPDDAHDVVATLSTDDAYITITDNTESYGTIVGDFGSVNIVDAFSFDVDPATPDGHRVTFTLTVTGTARDTWESTFKITVYAPEVTYVSFSVSDPTGNNNGMIDPGETADVIVTFLNSGSGTAYNVTAVLSELDPYVDLLDDYGSFGTIAGGGGSATNASDVFTITASPDCPTGHAVNCKLTISGDGGYVAVQYFSITVGDRVAFFFDDFAEDLGWTGYGGAGEWMRAACVGAGGDPATDHTPTEDNFVLGNDLTSDGRYNNSIPSTQWIYSPVLDCANISGVILTFWRWLGIESSAFDHAYLQAYDGTSWVELYHNGATLVETSWSEQVYDLSAIADHNPEFQLRFGLGPTDGSVTYCGWNIDDLELKGYVSSSGGAAAAQFAPTALADSLVADDQSVHNLIVRNIGEATLRIRFTPTVAWLQCSGSLIYIDPGDSLIHPVTFKATGLNPGDYEGMLGYTSNDPLHASGNINASLHVYAPQMSVYPTSIFQRIPNGGRDSTAVTIANSGAGKLNYYIECETYDKPASGKAITDASTTPLGYRVGDPDKGGLEEPFFAPMTKGSGGPDNFGNIWIDSNDPLGPRYNWIDISSSGTQITGLADDNFVGPFPIGFTFPFYGNDYTEFYIGSNGIIGFGPTTGLSSYGNTAIPNTATPNNLIAWCWDDLNINDPDSPGGQALYQLVMGELVVSFLDYPEYDYGTNPGDVITAQVILSPTGSVRIQYKEIAPGFDILGCTVGMENADGTDGLQVVYNAAYLQNELALYMGAPPPTWLSVMPASGSVPPFSSTDVWVYFDALDMVDSTCSGQLTVNSNDPATPQFEVPLTLKVGAVYIAGDANGDQMVTVSDAVYLISYLFSEGPAPEPLEAGDVDCNGLVTVSDAVYLIQYLFAEGPPPCEPGQ